MNQCFACSSSRGARLLELKDVPVYCNVPQPSPEQARSVPRGVIDLHICQECGHVYNAAFDPRLIEYEVGYENALHFSPRFVDYMRELANRLVDRHALRGKHLVEIACGQGEFLELLCKLGPNRGTGFDPGYAGDERPSDELRFLRAGFNRDHSGLGADFILCRHALEHLAEPVDLLRAVHTELEARSGATTFFEVPNGLWTLADLGIWDLIYEHCSYFWLGSLEHVFRRAGLEPIELGLAFGDQFLWIEAQARAAADVGTPPTGPAGLDRVLDHAAAFEEAYHAKLLQWSDRLADLRRAGKRALLWGAGSKGITFLNVLKPESELRYVIDVNPRKHGRFVAGTGQAIVPPEFAAEYRPDAVLVMNPIYMEEIQETLKTLGVRAECMSA